MKLTTVPLTAIRTHPKNPRKGSVDAIAESLRVNGQYRPLVVQQSSGHILAGNHTYRAMEALGWQSVKVVFMDVDDDAAYRIMLADNRTADLGDGYDNEILADILRGLPDLSGTGYNQDDLDLLQAALDGSQTDLSKILADGDDEPEDEPAAPVDDGWELPGISDLKPDPVFPQAGTYGLPPLLPDMLITAAELPRDLHAWAGSATPERENPARWWLYNWGVDSTSGMVDTSKIILSFFTYDDYFEPWWEFPDRYTAKAINSGVQYALTPDFSTYATQPRALNIWNLYRSRWLGRYFQEAGIKVAPHLAWPVGDEWFIRHVLLDGGLPPEAQVLGVQLQTIDKKHPGDIRKLARDLKLILDSHEPEVLIVYAGEPGRDLVHEIKPSCEILHVMNRGFFLTQRAKQRKQAAKRSLEPVGYHG